MTPSLWALALMLARLDGQTASLAGDGLTIDDIAGEGRPQVGVVEQRGDELWLVPPGIRLAGPLAHPRLLGPGYLVWVMGPTTDDVLSAERFGVLAAP